MFIDNAQIASWALGIFLATLALSAEPAKAQTRYICGYVEAKEAITCKAEGRTDEAFEYSLPGGAAVLARPQSHESAVASLSGLEAYREAAERFRGSKLEIFRNSLEAFRQRAEDERKTPSGDQALYDALIDAYWGLMDQYRNGVANYRAELQAYRESVYRIRVP